MNVLFLEEYFSQDYLIQNLNKERRISKIFKLNSELINTEDIDIIFTRLKYFLSSKFLSTYSNLKYIVTPTTGLTHIDNKYCELKNIQIISLKDETHILSRFTGTAELALGLMIALNLNLTKVINSTIKGEWERNNFMSFQLNEKTLGIVGFGRLGEMISNYGISLGMKIITYDPKKNINKKNIKQVSFDYLLSNSDFISIHANYIKDENHYLIGEREIDLIKRSAIFINTARGELVDLEYLIKKLKKGEIRGIGIDTIENEYEFDKSILSLQEKFNIIFTPHIGGCKYESTIDAEKIVFKLFLEKIK
tara:strand:+ start:348 stop:1271 length:924 start_codon:yes stop_codon:yes gene_type:complete